MYWVIYMYLRKTLHKKSGRIYLSIVKGYRDPKTKKVKQKLVKGIGYIDELEKDFDDPIAHFKKVAKKMSLEEDEASRSLSFKFTVDEKIDSSSVLRKNLGFSVLSYFYHKLDINNFFINRQRNLNIDYSLNDVFQLLVYARVLFPCSKKNAFELKDDFFMDFNFEIFDVYRALDYFYHYKDDLLLRLHENLRTVYGRNCSNVFYDVTNYYFEIDEPDSLRKKGVNKEHRPNPIVQMGLLMDEKGLPITYKLFEGNTNDCETLMPVLDDVVEKYGLGKIIVVADKGMNSGENIAYNILNKNGYIYSQTIRGASQEMKNYVLSDEGYTVFDSGFKIKSRIIPTNITVTNTKGKKVKVPIDQKQVVFYNPDYAKRARAQRELAIEKAKKMISSTSKKLPLSGSAKYILSTPCDTDTGELYKETLNIHSLNNAKIEEEMKYDGYYAIVTSELNMSDGVIVDLYRGLWKIEDSFKITKSQLKARPVFVSRKEHIEAHFLTCFVALLLLRLVELETKGKYSTNVLVREMRNITGTYLDQNYYMLDHFNEVVKGLGDITDIDFEKRFLTVGEIKNILASTKK